MRLDVKWPKDWPSVAAKLNEQADLSRPVDPDLPKDTVAYVVQSYRESDKFRSRSEATRRIYERWLRAIEHLFGNFHPEIIDRRMAVDFVEKVPTKAARIQAAAVLQNVLNRARYLGLVKANEASALGLARPKPRAEHWSEDEIAAFLQACEARQHGRGLRLGLLMLLYTGQRPSDVLKMRRDDYNGDLIRVVQKKTGKKLDVPVHRTLKAELDASLRESSSLFLVSRENGLQFTRQHFATLARKAMKDAGIVGKQLRDLRRTAVIKLAEAGAEIYQIAAVTGHSTQSIKVLIETYLVTTTPMARAAIRLWENGPGTQESNALQENTP